MLDGLVTLMVPENFIAVGQWYQNFAQTTDDQVRGWLVQAARNHAEANSMNSTALG